MIYVIIGAMVIWNLANTFLALLAVGASKMNTDQIDWIKSWYPFCELMKIRVSKDK